MNSELLLPSWLPFTIEYLTMPFVFGGILPSSSTAVTRPRLPSTGEFYRTRFVNYCSATIKGSIIIFLMSFSTVGIFARFVTILAIFVSCLIDIVGTDTKSALR